ncbi:MFS transporter [Micromonospora sp. WMMD1120]|uniref:MFS transporter n=1 Tax=Micromonospora sp. WMMD1120 TaxID=3016106 RepID=UPI0024163C02|nr:MFS transporter [Micromonospora sp. WMMD1120]MDG4809337.1 MFS transporter [Micromonospora sp. WMMD1120]
MTQGAQAPPAVRTGPGGHHRWRLLAVVSLAQFMVLLDTTVVALALPPIQHSLGAGATTIEWVVSGYVLCFGGLMLLGGRLADGWGRRATLITGVAVFTAASVACGAASSAAMLVAARAAQGVGAALLAPAAFSMVTSSFPRPRERATALGVFAALSGLGGTLGVVLGGLVTDAFSWRWIFYVNVPVGVLVVGGVLLFAGGRASAPVARRGRPDVVGAILVTAGLTMLVWATITITGDGWTSPWVLGPFGAAVLLLTAFVVLESRLTDPLVPIRRLSNRSMLVATVGRLLTAGVQAAVLFLGSFYLQRGMGYSTFTAGLSFLPLGVVAILITLVIPRLMQRLGARTVYLMGAVGSLAALAWWAWAPESGGYAGYVLPALLVLGASMQACTVPVNVAGISEVPVELHGVASATLTASFQVGTSLGVAVVASPALHRVTDLMVARTPASSAWSQGLRLGFAVAAVVALLNVVNAVLLPGRPAGAPPTG